MHRTGGGGGWGAGCYNALDEIMAGEVTEEITPATTAAAAMTGRGRGRGLLSRAKRGKIMGREFDNTPPAKGRGQSRYNL